MLTEQHIDFCMPLVKPALALWPVVRRAMGHIVGYPLEGVPEEVYIALIKQRLMVVAWNRLKEPKTKRAWSTKQDL